MAAIARWCFTHRIAVIGLWMGLLLALGGAHAAVGNDYTEGLSVAGTESTHALALLQKSLPAASGDSDEIVIHVKSGSVRAPAVQQRVSDVLAKVAQLPLITSVTSPYTAQGRSQVSSDGQTAYAKLQFSKQADDLTKPDIQKVVDTAQTARSSDLQVELGGPAITKVTRSRPGSGEVIGIVAAAIILFFAFGSLLGMLIPLLVALTGLGGGLLAIGLLSHPISVSFVTPTLAALIGLGVGIDYALFIVTRYRSGLTAGLEPEAAAVRALNTSGRAVLFAGGTVVIALLGLLVLRVSFLNGLGLGSAVTVAFTVASALTLLPALLRIFGVRLLSRKQRRALAANGPQLDTPSGAWARWADFVSGHKALLSTAVVVMIALLSVPALSIRLGSSDAGNDRTTTTTRNAYDLLANGFGPGFNGPLQLVAELKSPSDAQAFSTLLTEVKATNGVAAVQTLPTKPGATITVASVVATTAPQAKETSQLIDRLRADVIPAAERGTSLQVYVGGATATSKDFASVLGSKLPLFLAVIIALGCLLLMLAFRSIVVPLTAAVMNLLAAAASFGVVVAIFQWGWGADLLHIGGPGPVEAFIPVIMIAILFGLSMDYQVFLVSRMHEEWTRTHDNQHSIRTGQAQTGRVVTAAAAIMIFVFGAFILTGQRIIAEFGTGLTAAVIIDAFLLRSVLVPTLMHVLGRSNWWLPGWLDRIMPHLSVEANDEPDQPAPGVTPDDNVLARLN